MDFGIPETYAAQDWARAYKEALEDHKKIVKSLSKWAWALKTNGNRAMVDAAAKSLQSTLGSDATGWIEGNPAPVGGSIAVTGGNTSLEAVDVSKANVDPESFRRLQLMVCAAFGIPETFMGDANVGNLATSTSLDRPTELKFKDRQTLWASIIQDILTIVIEAAARAPGNDNCHAMDYDPITGQLRITATDSDSDEPIAMTVTVDFPPILQRDVQAQMQALVTAVTMNGQPIQVMNDGPTLIRLIATALGIDNTDKIVELFYPADDSDSKARPIETYSGPPTPDVGHAGAMKPADPTGQKTEASPSPNAVAAAGDAAATHAAEAMRDALAKLTSVLEAQSPAEPKE
jgi:hypothetical protein